MNTKVFKGLSLFFLLVLVVSVIAACSPDIENTQTEAVTTTEPAPIYATSTNYSIRLTPVEKMGITGVAQDVDIDEYRLTVDGLVEIPLSLTYQDILGYPSVTDIGVINCPGFFVDTGEWTGVPVRTLLAEAVVKSGATQLTFRALDGYTQSLSLEHIDKFDVFLAYIVNGQTLPLEHGYPLRVVDNGSIGFAWIKWVENIEVK
jgi:DMSO/TMAO reductase YedYZ molybdopterin-dependent catalytic subunit